MFISTLALTAAAAAKWLTAAKVIGATGMFLGTAGPIIDRAIEKEK